MGKDICLDTDSIIEYLKGRNAALKKLLLDGTEVYTTSISAFELRLRETNIEEVEAFLKDIKILPFDDISSKIASNTFKELKKKGNPIELKDFFIASIAIKNNCKLLTNNKKHFERVGELELA
ncbi:MAG: PIN domain nuclease [Candidatus Diapherotrites archaeon CG11_big_fil_rev_8_21_14_0_20_37_9]|nr:MAG: PIN domain nuclease [Candidatus Diapherotrites archaeon CG11_big_fil_rev_8_21_14_0_20_37_9]